METSEANVWFSEVCLEALNGFWLFFGHFSTWPPQPTGPFPFSFPPQLLCAPLRSRQQLLYMPLASFGVLLLSPFCTHCLSHMEWNPPPLSWLPCSGFKSLSTVTLSESFYEPSLHPALSKKGPSSLPTKVCIVKGMVFPVVMYGCVRWTTKKAKHQRIDAFKMWCWRRLLRVPWTARRSNQSTLKEINPEYSLEGLMLKLKLQNFGHLMRRANSLEKILMLGKTEGRRTTRQQRMRWLYSITDSMDMNLSKLQEIMEGQGSLPCSSDWTNSWVVQGSVVIVIQTYAYQGGKWGWDEMRDWSWHTYPTMYNVYAPTSNAEEAKLNGSMKTYKTF